MLEAIVWGECEVGRLDDRPESSSYWSDTGFYKVCLESKVDKSLNETNSEIKQSWVIPAYML